MKEKLIPLIISLCITSQTSASAANMSLNDDTTTMPSETKDEIISSTLPIAGATNSGDDAFNYKNFEVEAPEDMNCYLNAWLIPAMYADGTYTSYIVFVNNEYVGKITPSFGNWQSAEIDSNEEINLKKGTNLITFATKAPEMESDQRVHVMDPICSFLLQGLTFCLL